MHCVLDYVFVQHLVCYIYYVIRFPVADYVCCMTYIMRHILRIIYTCVIYIYYTTYIILHYTTYIMLYLHPNTHYYNILSSFSRAVLFIHDAVHVDHISQLLVILSHIHRYIMICLLNSIKDL